MKREGIFDRLAGPSAPTGDAPKEILRKGPDDQTSPQIQRRAGERTGRWKKSEMTVGRKPENDLVIDNPAVSGRHCRIFKEGAAISWRISKAPTALL
jgi:pSer/pThr/pTyr-binding forkhead associated (FHA) protein